MALAGFLLVLAGVGGLLAHHVVDIDPGAVGAVTGGSWVAIVVGVLLMLAAMADGSLGRGVFPLSGGIAGLVMQKIVHWMDQPAIATWQLWLGIGLAAMIVGGALAVAYYDGFEDDRTVLRLFLFSVASLVTDIVFDFGAGWDELMNVNTVFFTACLAFSAVWVVSDEILGDDHTATTYFTTMSGRAVTACLGLSALLLTIMASFQLPAFVNALLTAVAMFGAYSLIVLLVLLALVLSTGSANIDLATVDGVRDAFEATDRRRWLGSSLGIGSLAVVSLVELVVLRPAVWVAVLIVALAVAGAAIAAIRGYLAATDLVRNVLAEAAERERAAVPSITATLNLLAHSNPVFRLLPIPGLLIPPEPGTF